MVIKGIIKKGKYFDSVSLMIVSKEINEVDGVIDSAVVMGTKENRAILDTAGLLLRDFDNTNDTDLLIAVKAEDESAVSAAMERVDNLFEEMTKSIEDTSDFQPKSFDGALKALPNADLSLISVAGKYAAAEAMKALRKGLHVMIFSDNVSIEDEIKLKKFAQEKGLLVMGPDCGTAIINGIPLAFANEVNRGNIGMAAASGTGLQEVSSIITNLGGGISQAIGTGGRDISKDVGGIMFIEALKALNEDDQTEIIVLVSKPPHSEALQKISEEIKNIKKPIVGMFIGGNPEIVEKAGAIPVDTLEKAALAAVALSRGESYEDAISHLNEREIEIDNLAETETKIKNENQKYLRGLFSGGTLCDETQLILQKLIGNVYGNSPLSPEYKLKNSKISVENTILDVGADEFTVGRPHPMIDFSLRNKMIVDEAKNDETAVILLDVVLGYGANLTPAEELAPVIKEVKDISPNLSVICSITGTDKDPQNREKVKTDLKNTGAIVMESNAAASELTGKIIKNLMGK